MFTAAWAEGLVMGLCIMAAPMAFCIGGQVALSNFMASRSAMVKEIHGALVDVGGRIAGMFNKKAPKNESDPHPKTDAPAVPDRVGPARPDAVDAPLAVLPNGTHIVGISCDHATGELHLHTRTAH